MTLETLDDVVRAIDGVTDVDIVRDVLRDTVTIVVRCAVGVDADHVRGVVTLLAERYREIGSVLRLYVSHCVAHSDCREHPEIGRACAQATLNAALLA